MTMRFIPCRACLRHVKAADTACPFCGPALPQTPPVAPVVQGRVSRSALFAAGAVGTALAVASCSSSDQPTDGGPTNPPGADAAADGPTHDGSNQAGADAADAKAPDGAATQEGGGASSDAAPDGTVVALYGGFVPPDASTARDANASDGVVAVPAYGAFIPPADATDGARADASDARAPDGPVDAPAAFDGSVVALYGAFVPQPDADVDGGASGG